MLRGRVAEAGCAIAYVNQVGGQDELVFDGDSLLMGADGTLVASGAQFAEDLVLVDLPVGPHRPHGVSELLPRIVVSEARPTDRAPLPARPARPALSDHAEVYAALVLGTRDYLGKNGFSEAVIGLSGGIDSSLVAAVAVDALGPKRVHGISMPSRYSSEGSRDDAVVLAERLGIDLKVVPIEEAHVAFSSMLAPLLGREPFGLTDENLQSRLRGVLLMAVSNAKGWIVLTTGNKSEMATGYSTLYGDSAGGFAVIKDVPKTLVYDLCRYRNTQAVLEGLPGPIPDAVLDKPPSAELRPDQRDDQSLPAYEELDPVLQGYVEGDRTAAELVAEGFAPDLVDQVVRLVDGAEYKRRQMPPGVRITTKAFGKDRRMPITNRYRSSALEESGMADAPPRDSWLDIHELAVLVGAYCWIEQRVFALTGEWAARRATGARGATDAHESDGPDDAELRVWCAASSRRHGALAARWAARLPVRAGVDPDALIAPPPGRVAARLEELEGESDLQRGVATLVGGLLPALAAIYDTHRRAASPVSEGPVLEVLVAAHRELLAETRGGGALIGGFEAGADGPGGSVNLRQTFEQLLNQSGVFPAVRPS
jgi:NAD+ synthetase